MNTISFAAAYLLSSTLADRFFEPLMAENRALVATIGQILGSGSGRGMGLIFAIMGVLSILSALSAFAYPRIRHMERELSDMVEG
jgi:hypothetical protein